MSKKFLADYPDNHNFDGCLLFAANSSLATGDKAGALGYFGKLHTTTAEAQAPDHIDPGFLGRGKIRLRCGFPTAHRLSLPAEGGPESRGACQAPQKNGALRTLASDTSPVSPRLKKAPVCIEETKSYCDHLDTIVRLNATGVPSSKEALAAAAKATQLGSGSDAAIWAVIALRNSKALPNKERIRVLEALASRWSSSAGSSAGAEDTIVQFLLIPYLPQVVRGAVQLVRQDVALSAHIKQIKKQTLSKRVQSLAGLEKLTDQVLKMPWSSVRLSAYGELAQAYADFATEIRKVPPPRGLAGQDLKDYQGTLAQVVDPLTQKSDSFRKQASI